MAKQIDDIKLLAELNSHHDEAEKSLEGIRDAEFSWDDRENMLVGILTDTGSKKTNSKVNTQDLVNLVFDGASRVMAQFPTGTIQALTNEDKGKNAMMNIVHERYIIPNADAQYDFLTKLRMWDIYSRVFGSMPALVDYRVEDDYVGPDMWLIHPRAFFPQSGAINVNEMAYCQVSTWVDVEYLKGRDKKIWKNLPKLIKNVEEGAKSKQQQDTKYQPVNERLNTSLTQETGQFAQCELMTEYRKDRWITYSKEFNLIVRDIPNPQHSSELPIVMKHCFPLIDRLYGLAEFERGHTLQKAANSLVNLYMSGVEMSIFPPLLLDQNGIVASSIEYKAKAKWLMTKANAISQLQLSPQGMNTFNSTYSFLKSQMLNLGATTDTSISKDVDPGKGKTPEALKQQNAREGARDNWDRFMMEQALEKVNQKFIDLLTTKQEKPIDVTLFKSDIEKLSKAFPDEEIATVFSSGDAGQLKVTADQWKEIDGLDKDGKEIIKTIKFKYTIDSGSTMKSDDEAEHQALTDQMLLIMKFPGAMEQIGQSGKFIIGDKTYNFAESMKRYILSSGIQDGEKIISDNEEGEEEEPNTQQQVQQLAQQVEQLTQGLTQIAEEMAKKPEEKKIEDSINYKDSTPYIKAQLEAKAGLQPDPIHETEHMGKHVDEVSKAHSILNPQEEEQQINGE